MRKGIIAGAVMAAVMLGGAACSQAQTGGGGSGGGGKPTATYGCTLPTTPPAASAGKADFAVYSWQTFIALNWPMQAGKRGVPDCGKTIGGGGPTVWQSYRTVESIFLPGARDPGPWNTPMSPASLSQSAKASKVVMSSAMGGVLQPVGGWLIDQNGNPTYYDIAVNQASYDYIRSNGFYNANTVNSSRTIAFPNGTIEIKAAWRILTPAEDASRYLTMSAQVVTFDAKGNPNPGAPKTATLGLVGLHAITKAPGFPQWIWATFEQVDNVTAPPTGRASYSDPKAPASAVNKTPCQPGVLPCTPKAGTTFQTPDPLTRVTPIDPAVATVNAAVQKQFGSTFLKYYQLVGTQWPADPGDPGNPLGTPTPNILANVTMESYLQPTSSCMACHSTAVSGSNRYKSDFSFLFIHAQAPAAGN